MNRQEERRKFSMGETNGDGTQKVVSWIWQLGSV